MIFKAVFTLFFACSLNSMAESTWCKKESEQAPAHVKKESFKDGKDMLVAEFRKFTDDLQESYKTFPSSDDFKAKLSDAEKANWKKLYDEAKQAESEKFKAKLNQYNEQFERMTSTDNVDDNKAAKKYTRCLMTELYNHIRALPPKTNLANSKESYMGYIRSIMTKAPAASATPSALPAPK
jgi:hypothetical protein